MKRRAILARRLLLDEMAAGALRDSWKRDGMALGIKPRVVKVYPRTVRCDGELIALFVVVAYGLPIDKG